MELIYIFDLSSVWKTAELKQALLPTLNKLSSLDPESQPFLFPVDPVILGIPVRNIWLFVTYKKNT